jgi:cyclopropane fatty-acyl-phospholipid synthase-like methyltransferase
MFYYTEALRESRAAGLEVFAGTEDNLYGRLARDPQLEQIFQEAMARRSRHSNGALVEHVRFSAYPRILDVGGGNGENLVTIGRRFPNVGGTLMDFPTVADRARLRFQAEGFVDRFTAEGRNFLAEEFPAGYSCVLMGHLTPIFSPETNRELFRKAYAALDPGGILCVYAPFVYDDETGPPDSALLSPYFLCTVNGQGRHYSVREVTTWMTEAGFLDLQRRQLTVADHVLIGRRPR